MATAQELKSEMNARLAAGGVWDKDLVKKIQEVIQYLEERIQELEVLRNPINPNDLITITTTEEEPLEVADNMDKLAGPGDNAARLLREYSLLLRHSPHIKTGEVALLGNIVYELSPARNINAVIPVGLQDGQALVEYLGKNMVDLQVYVPYGGLFSSRESAEAAAKYRKGGGDGLC